MFLVYFNSDSNDIINVAIILFGENVLRTKKATDLGTMFSLPGRVTHLLTSVAFSPDRCTLCRRI